MTTTKEITIEVVYAIRHLVLRKGKPIESCHFDGDKFTTTKHFGIEFENKIVGVVSLYELKNELFKENIQFQIRGMAILEEFHKKGFGKLLIHEVETYCKGNNADLIWFNAREKAVPFYKKSDYLILNEPFNIKDIGLHYVMFKKLKLY